MRSRPTGVPIGALSIDDSIDESESVGTAAVLRRS
jgi:hypothetical protein